MAKKGKPKRVQADDGSMDRKGLLAALKLTQAAVDKSGVTGVDQARDYILRRDRVIAYNDLIAISAPLEIDTKLDLTVRAEDLYAVLNGIKDERVTLDLDDDGQLIISSENTTAWLSVEGLGEVLEDLIEGMGLGELEEKGWQALPEDFVDGLLLCSFAASPRKENVAFHALYFDGRNVWATDDYRISNYKFGKDIEFEYDGVLVPLGSIRELCKHNPTHTQLTKSWVHYRDGNGLYFSARTVETDYPDCAEYIKVDGEPVTLPVALAEALEAVAVFAYSDDVGKQEAEIQFTKKGLVCVAQNSRGKMERRVPVASHEVADGLVGLPTIIINPTFFAEVLARVTTLTVGKGRALFTTKKFKHVMNLKVQS